MEKSTKKITPHLAKTAEVLNLPPSIINEVILHHFASINDFLTRPTHDGCHKIPYFGTYFIPKYWLYASILKLTKALRRTDLSPSRRQLFTEDLRYLFTNRHQLTSYASSREFKKRFNGWHYK